MKKLHCLALVLVALAVLGLALAGCAGKKEAPAPAGDLKVEPQVYPPKIIEHKTSSFGGNPPEWVFTVQEDLEQSDKFKDQYVFVFDEKGGDLDGLKAWTRSFVAASEVARMVSTRVNNKFAGAQVGDKNMVETYMEEVVQVLAQAQYSGARKVDDFWVLQQTYTDQGKPDKKEYRYLLLYAVPRQQIDDAIQRALDETAQKSKPKTEEENKARERVQELFSTGM
jgi:hypothetical protein